MARGFSLTNLQSLGLEQVAQVSKQTDESHGIYGGSARKMQRVDAWMLDICVLMDFWWLRRVEIMSIKLCFHIGRWLHPQNWDRNDKANRFRDPQGLKRQGLA